MTIHHYEISKILVAPTRQRRHFDGAKIIELANSIQEIGLLQPLTIRAGGTLVAGERRLRACKHLSMLGIGILCAGEVLPPGQVPVIFFDNQSDIAAWQAQLDENIRRENLTWQEEAAAVAELHELRTKINPAHTLSDTSKELNAGRSDGDYLQKIRRAVIVSGHLEDKEVAAAASVKDAMKLLKKREEKERYAHLSENTDIKLLSSLHELHACDWRSAPMQDGSIDVILTDPPYGMGAHTFKDGGGAVEVLHEYNDMGEGEWNGMMEEFAKWSFRVTKDKAHLYVFCDIDKYHFLWGLLHCAGWKCHRTPFVYAKSHASSRRVPWPLSGPRRGYELVLYAVKGDRNVIATKSDVCGPFATDDNLGHAAQKPVELYKDLLSRSINPGDIVCDPFAGTGTIFPAAHQLKCRAIACESDPAFQGMCVERLNQIKDDV